MNRSDFILTGIVLAVSSFPFFTTGYLFNIIGFILFASIFVIRKLRFDITFIYFLLFLTALLIGQALIFQFMSIRTTLGIYISFIKAYLAIKIIGKSFFDYFLKWMVIFTLISFVFFIPSLVFPSFESFLISEVAPFFERTGSRYGYSYNPNFIIYTLNTGITNTSMSDFYFFPGRNPGPFHEAGGFAVFLVPAIAINAFRKGVFFSRWNLILTAGLISTFSTSGYIALGVFSVLYIFIQYRAYASLFLLPLLIWGFYIAFTSIGFLGEKIETRFTGFDVEAAQKAQRRERFANFIVDMNDAVHYPLTGRGANEHTRFANFEEFNGKTHKNNGVSDLAATYGLVFFIVYFVLLFRAFKVCFELYSENIFMMAGSLLFLVLLVGFSQVVFENFFFLTLMFLGLLPKENFKNA
ncbi:MAG: hypothetical protein HQ500_12615 [Flavobacteriales bacterium]|nr:hypothetical protein [Flavobacteriales bacterium]